MQVKSGFVYFILIEIEICSIQLGIWIVNCINLSWVV